MTIEVDVALQVQLPPPLLTVMDDSESSEILSESQWQRYFEQWVNALSPQISKIQSYEVSLVLTSDAEIQALNATYRHQDMATDVLAFAALEWEGPPNPALEHLPTPLGDIAISVETAARQAAEQGHDLKLELLWLASHGLLHLLGWDHPDAAHLHRMLAEQTHLLNLIGLQPPSWSVQSLGYI